MSSLRHILLVEDNDSEREAFRRMLHVEGYDVTAVRGPQQAMERKCDSIDLIVTDLCMGHQSGLDLLRSWRALRPQTPFLMLTAFGTVSAAVEAMKLGAIDFLAKPVDPTQLLDLIAASIGGPLSQAADPEERGLTRIVGCSPAMETIREQIRKVASSNATALVLGESGTGKELVADAIHFHSSRVKKPFVAVNISELPETLVESELFGHVKGAFTNAVSDHAGRFEAAQGGTLFIDEIGDITKAVQSKLLRVLETHSITPVGGDRPITVDVRVIAATSKPLAEMVRSGEFREDLYYRLNVVAIRVPPLRDRREDVPVLTQFFLDGIARQFGKPPSVVSPELMAQLEQFDWPGNVRQLKNCLESICVLSNSAILTPADLPADLQQMNPDAEYVPAPLLDSIKKRAMQDALQRFDGNRTQAAQYLGISVRTLQRKLREWQAEESP